MEYSKVDPERIIEELKRLIDRINVEKSKQVIPDEKNVSATPTN